MERFIGKTIEKIEKSNTWAYVVIYFTDGTKLEFASCCCLDILEHSEEA